MNDPNRVLVEAELVGQALAPSIGSVTVSATMQIWAGDNPTLQQLQLRVLDTLARAFAIPDELRHQLGAVYTSDQIRVAAAQ
jgi:hypothetical protein